MLGHSMGGHVTLIVAAALGDRLQGSSIWSVSLPSAATKGVLESELTLSSQLQLGKISGPVNIHHAKDDPTTVFEGSAALAQKSRMAGENHQTISIPERKSSFYGRQSSARQLGVMSNCSDVLWNSKTGLKIS